MVVIANQREQYGQYAPSYCRRCSGLSSLENPILPPILYGRHLSVSSPIKRSVVIKADTLSSNKSAQFASGCIRLYQSAALLSVQHDAWWGLEGV
eukprot:4441981-Pyramimonas_sp.AAC.2